MLTDREPREREKDVAGVPSPNHIEPAIELRKDANNFIEIPTRSLATPCPIGGGRSSTGSKGFSDPALLRKLREAL
jgi:hypothetical protein